MLKIKELEEELKIIEQKEREDFLAEANNINFGLAELPDMGFKGVVAVVGILLMMFLVQIMLIIIAIFLDNSSSSDDDDERRRMLTMVPTQYSHKD